ncbi:MAG: hypothetical protein LRZ88_09985 [Candidatus Cloacimonetes bacterium]|nr:hypothetical protein [Candidatus Cloacimonadota bacterium]
MVHIIRSSNEQSETLKRNRELIGDYAECIKFLQKHSENSEKSHTNLPAKALLNQINKARSEKESLTRTKDGYLKQIKDLQPWGHFDYELVQKLKAAGIFIDFHHCLKNHFKAEWEEQYPIIKVAERSGSLYFAVLYTGDHPALEADTFSFHQHTLQEFETKLKEVEDQLADIESYFANICQNRDRLVPSGDCPTDHRI